MKAKAIDKLEAAMKAIGGSVDNSSEFSLYLDAPSGYVWRANDTPTLHIHYANHGGQTWLMEAIRKEMPSIKMGLEKVTDEDRLAEIRYNNDDDSWGAPAEAPERLNLNL